MTTLDMLGPAIWRASWQAAALALVVAFLARCLGERLAPRWRFWLWGVVVARLLLVITPASPWSAFNLAPHTRQASARITDAPDRGELTPTPDVGDSPAGHIAPNTEPAPVAADAPAPSSLPPPATTPAKAPATGSELAVPQPPVIRVAISTLLNWRSLSIGWLAGVLLVGARLLATVFMLRRRLSACRAVTDGVLTNLLEDARIRAGLMRAPALLVTPECISPCVVGRRDVTTSWYTRKTASRSR